MSVAYASRGKNYLKSEIFVGKNGGVVHDECWMVTCDHHLDDRLSLYHVSDDGVFSIHNGSVTIWSVSLMYSWLRCRLWEGDGASYR